MASIRVLCVSVAVLFWNYSVEVYSRTWKKDIYDFNFISRDGWHALPSKDKRPLNLPAPYVVVHHTYIPGACYDEEQCAKAMRSMQIQHNNQNWGDIGYNFCVGTEGSAFEGRGWDFKGVHASFANNHSVGICMIGDWREQLPPEEQMDTLIALIRTGVRLGKIEEDYKLIGHMQASNTECPGSALMAELSNWEHYSPGNPDFWQIKLVTDKHK